jgi:hypothetical protein
VGVLATEVKRQPTPPLSSDPAVLDGMNPLAARPKDVVTIDLGSG